MSFYHFPHMEKMVFWLFLRITSQTFYPHPMSTIRPYTPSDKPELINLLHLNIPKYFDEAEAEGLVYYLDHQIEEYFVVEEDGSTIGCGGINYEDDSKTAVISWDIIHPQYQGKGLGRKLTEFRIQHIKSISTIQQIIVRTSQHTDKFYEKMGFKLIEIKKDYWAKGFDLYYMQLKV